MAIVENKKLKQSDEANKEQTPTTLIGLSHQLGEQRTSTELFLETGLVNDNRSQSTETNKKVTSCEGTAWTSLFADSFEEDKWLEEIGEMIQN